MALVRVLARYLTFRAGLYRRKRNVSRSDFPFVCKLTGCRQSVILATALEPLPRMPHFSGLPALLCVSDVCHKSPNCSSVLNAQKYIDRCAGQNMRFLEVQSLWERLDPSNCAKRAVREMVKRLF